MGLREPLVEGGDGAYDVLQARALPAEALRLLGIGPDGRILELAENLLEALALSVDVKDTP